MKRTEIINELVARGYKAEAKDHIKNGVVCKGIIIKNDSAIAPIIYTQHLIEAAEETGKGVADVVTEIIRIYEDNQQLEVNIDKLFDKEFIFNHIYIGVQKKSNDNFLVKRDCGYDGIEAYVYVRGDNAEGTWSMKIDKTYLDHLKLSIEEIWKKAEINTYAETVIQSMAQILSEMCGIPYDESMELDIPMYVVSNKIKNKGASSILDKLKLKEFAKKHQVDQLIVFPSSIHEMLILPYNPNIDMEDMTDMVRQINAAEVTPEERLTDQAYLIEI